MSDVAAVHPGQHACRAGAAGAGDAALYGASRQRACDGCPKAGRARPPYWAYQWAGGTVLARHFLDRPETVRGRRVLDLGAGSGVVGIAAALAGASRVTGCRDRSPCDRRAWPERRAEWRLRRCDRPRPARRPAARRGPRRGRRPVLRQGNGRADDAVSRPLPRGGHRGACRRSGTRIPAARSASARRRLCRFRISAARGATRRRRSTVFAFGAHSIDLAGAPRTAGPCKRRQAESR